MSEGVWELRIDIGPGYRVYYAKSGLTVVLLLCGGDKRKQNPERVNTGVNGRVETDRRTLSVEFVT
ncbi:MULTISPECIES: hypothetical protein [Photorhabdus]|uniref:Photorhabdus luminescens subsp. laumondii TTO1 complete genome segment 3/17 n=1 Tax=Photorhabdus laumondii subsp. laumondii (strain DSM 15139 / CIP 105565 / TT01) TaxID=243265 RepID=Q7N8S1_PHOLL|nr:MULTISPECIES: hypothetical protein [Photorhabdus]CAE12942.1 unnamed protein product [Photorhabdus laumondii subsp. laumondii TTO1]